MEAPGHAATLGVTPIVMGLAIEFWVTSIDPWKIEDTNSNIGEMDMNHWKNDHVICATICGPNGATTPCAFLSN